MSTYGDVYDMLEQYLVACRLWEEQTTRALISAYGLAALEDPPREIPMSADSSLQDAVLERVPQRRYENGISFTPRPSIEFRVSENQYLNLGKALHGDFGGLERQHALAFPGIKSKKLSFRLEWPGPWGQASISYGHQINVLDSTPNANSISVEKLARIIAKEVAIFIENRSRHNTCEYRWMLGPGHIDIDHLFLVKLEHVSHASVQPVLAVMS